MISLGLSEQELQDLDTWRATLDQDARRTREAEQFATAIVRGMLGVERAVLVEAVERGLCACLRLGLLPTRRSVRLIALGFLAPLVDTEIDRLLAGARRRTSKAA